MIFFMNIKVVLLFRNFSSFDIDCTGSLAKINDFWLVVETKAESSDVNTTNSSLHQR